MKKLFTLLFTFGCLTSVFAQYDNDNRGRYYENGKSTAYDSRNYNDNFSKPAPVQESYGRSFDKREYASNDHRYNDAYSMNSRERDFRIQKVGHDYDFRINSVYANRYLRPSERDWQIQNLQKRKYDEWRSIEICFSDSRNRYYEGHSNRW
jgi:hypothetical protein